MKIKKKINDILPSFISFNNFRYIETENNFYNGFYVSNYNETYKSLIFEKLINSPIEGSINIYIDKKNKTEIIKQVTSYINLVDSSSNKSAQDFELINNNINIFKRYKKRITNKKPRILFYFCLHN